ncbi:MAG: fatty acid cis/trans isomerase [Rhodomicrobium sp.]
MKSYKNFAIWTGGLFVLTLAVCGALEFSYQPENADARAAALPSEAPYPYPIEPASYEAVQKLFDARCVACHSCNNAPCQLKLTSYEGLQRGASKIEAIHPTRLQSIPPTRLGIDARLTEEWHKNKGFFPVVDDQIDLIPKMVNQGSPRSPAETVDSSRTCPANMKEFEALNSSHPEKLMPYGLPPLTQAERAVFASWVQQGRKPPAAKPSENLPPQLALAKTKWEEFLNRQDLEHRLVARYLYEHLFLASVHFREDSRRFYRIIRSRTPCDHPLDEIATRRPSDDPKETFQYCFRPSDETTVEKTLLPYTLDQAKLNRIGGFFFDQRQPWKVLRWPDYQSPESTNPFVIYQDIPVKARYSFLLEDSQYHVGTFIKGPVCYGNGAVNSIDEHFFVFFMNPDSELMALDPEFAKESENLLVLPYKEGSDAPYFGNLSLDEMWESIRQRSAFTDKYVEARNEYIKLKNSHRLAAFKNGYKLSDLWNGDGSNPNAVLTVFRHYDHSYVLKGLRGGEASSYFVLDYGLFERLVYNLVVGYDVFGNLSHQIHTRLYMETLRREAEDNFLLFLPPPERARLHGRWYQGEIAQLEKKPFFEPDDNRFPTGITYRNSSQNAKEFIAKMGGEHLSAAARGQYDGTPHSEYPALEPMAEKEASSAPFVKLFPDSSFVLIEANGRLKKVVTVVRDRAHSALGRFVLESTARVPEQDRLAIVDDLATSYPNLFFVVPKERLPDFLQQLNAVKSLPSAQAFLKTWAILKTNPEFWAVSDRLHAYLLQLNPVEFGILDYTRYGLWSEAGDWH